MSSDGGMQTKHVTLFSFVYVYLHAMSATVYIYSLQLDAVYIIFRAVMCHKN